MLTALPAPRGRAGKLRGAVRAHHSAEAHLQGGFEQRRRLLREGAGELILGIIEKDGGG